MTTALRPGSYRTPTARRYRTPVWLQNKTSDDWEGTVQWVEQADALFYADINPKKYKITLEGNNETLVDKLLIYVPYRDDVPVGGDCVQRLRTETLGLFFYIESVIEIQTDTREFEITATQRVEMPTLGNGIPILDNPQPLWLTLEGSRVVRLDQ